MCTAIINHETHTEIESPSELEALVAPHPLIPFTDYGQIDYGCCLCQVDVQSTLESAGYVYQVINNDPMSIATWRTDSPHSEDYRALFTREDNPPPPTKPELLRRNEDG